MTTDQAAQSWLELAADLLARPLRALPRRELAEQLLSTLDSDGCAFTSTTAGPSMSAFWPPEFWGGPPEYDNAEIAALESTGHHPIVQYYAARGSTPVMQIADIPAVFHDDWKRRGLDSYYRRVGAPHHLAVPVRSSHDGHVAFVLGRSVAYTEAEIALARTVQRLIVGLDRQVLALPVGIAPDAGLTSRESAVLALLAEGLTAAAIGRRLLIAEGTVHKHLRNVYAKLGVSDRLSAVVRAHRLGVLADGNTEFSV